MEFRRERRRSETHRSTTDPEARLVRKGKGKEARLCFWAHVLMDNREGLVVDVRLTPSDGARERDAALETLASAPGTRRITVGADRGYDNRSETSVHQTSDPGSQTPACDITTPEYCTPPFNYPISTSCQVAASRYRVNPQEPDVTSPGEISTCRAEM